MHTEAEAREKWCPFTRVGEQASGAAENRPNGSFVCIASECMAWRQDNVRFEGKNEITGETQVTERAGDRYVNKGWSHEEFATGYCGLAGKP